MSQLRIHSALAASAAAAAILVATCPALAHVVETVGPYTVEIGWRLEPAYVGESNGVQVIVHDADEQPVTDLADDDLVVVVSTGDQQTGELLFEPGFDAEEMEGPLGEYDAAIQPTAPGDYTFHISGNIHGEPVDLSVTSGEETFDTVTGTSAIQFPTTLPSLAELVTRLDRIEARLTESEADTPSASAAPDEGTLGTAGLGLVGPLVALSALALALRGSRRKPV